MASPGIEGLQMAHTLGPSSSRVRMFFQDRKFCNHPIALTISYSRFFSNSSRHWTPASLKQI
jgi:hypothetical protein